MAPRQLAKNLGYPAKAGLVGLGRFELPTSRLSSARSNQLSYRPRAYGLTRAVLRTAGNGCSNNLWIAWARPRRKRNVDGEVPQIGMPILKLTCPDVPKRSDSGTRMRASEGSSLERRRSSRRFPYGYLVTTSPQSLTLPWPAASLRLAHRLQVKPTPMVWRAVCT